MSKSKPTFEKLERSLPIPPKGQLNPQPQGKKPGEISPKKPQDKAGK